MTANNGGWIDWTWTKEKPYPESLETVVDVKFGDGEVYEGAKVEWWYCDCDLGNAWLPFKDPFCVIVAYRVIN